jgi:hypothetical protein
MTGDVEPSEAPGFLGDPFRLESLDEIAAPAGGSGIWQRYVIVQGHNTITGMRPGTRAEVSPQIDDMVERLNERFRKGQAGGAGGAARKAPPRVGQRAPEAVRTTE